MPRKISWPLGLSLFGLLVLLPSVGLCAVPENLTWPADEARETETGSTQPDVVSGHGLPDIRWDRFLFAIGLVIALACAGAYFAKRLGGWPLNKGRHLEVLEATSLGRKTRLFLVKVAGRVVLFATNGENVVRISEFAEAELPELETDGKQGRLNGFKTLLNTLTGGQR